jgi:hypothetical protein
MNKSEFWNVIQSHLDEEDGYTRVIVSAILAALDCEGVDTDDLELDYNLVAECINMLDVICITAAQEILHNQEVINFEVSMNNGPKSIDDLCAFSTKVKVALARPEVLDFDEFEFDLAVN